MDEEYVKASLAKTSMKAMALSEKYDVPVKMIEDVLSTSLDNIGILTEAEKKLSWEQFIVNRAMKPVTKEERKELLRKFHPDNLETGDIEKFQEINNKRIIVR